VRKGNPNGHRIEKDGDHRRISIRRDMQAENLAQKSISWFQYFTNNKLLLPRIVCIQIYPKKSNLKKIFAG